jgi:hypothetical protein
MTLLIIAASRPCPGLNCSGGGFGDAALPGGRDRRGVLVYSQSVCVDACGAAVAAVRAELEQMEL